MVRSFSAQRVLTQVMALALLAASQIVARAAESEPKSENAASQETPRAIAGGIEWHTDYYTAYNAAKRGKRMLLINVAGANAAGQQSAERFIASSAPLRAKLAQVELLRVPVDATISVEGKQSRLLSFPAFAQLSGGPGFVLIDLRNQGQPYYGSTVNVLPFASGKYYHWRPDYLSVIIDLPAGTLTQRTMVWAVRIHPERPQSTFSMQNPTLADGAAQQASYQASVGQQGHQNFESRYHSLSAAAGGSVSEVCAESWPNQNMIDSCLDCVDSWRHSSGHWRGVSGRNRAFGYDIRRGRNGIWYGTGIFAN